MKSRISLITSVVSAGCLLYCAACLGVPMGTAFTYQGRFTSGGSPAGGAYDFEFTLFDAATGGNQVGSPVAKENLSVADGYFTTTLDFASGAFAGEARWLQIAVRPGAETGVYTTLTPRHELTPTPYTLFLGTGTANCIPKFAAGGMANSAMYESSGNIGIGTTTPSYKLDVNGMVRAAAISAGVGRCLNIGDNGVGCFYNASWGNPEIGLRWANEAGTHWSQTVYSSGNDIGMKIASSSGAVFYMGYYGGAYLTGGNLGIGTTAPHYPLDVQTEADVHVGIFSVSGNAYLNAHNAANSLNCPLRIGASSLKVDISGATKMTVDSGGNVGIGTTAPVYKLDVNGDIYCSGTYQSSDEQLKTEVQPLAGVLDKLDRIRAVSFRWNEKARTLGAKTSTRQIGVLAQELEQVFPELVRTPEPITVDELLKGYSGKALTAEVRQQLQEDAEKTHYKAVNYGELTVVLLEAVKELQAENRSLEQRLRALEKRDR